MTLAVTTLCSDIALVADDDDGNAGGIVATAEALDVGGNTLREILEDWDGVINIT